MQHLWDIDIFGIQTLSIRLAAIRSAAFVENRKGDRSVNFALAGSHRAIAIEMGTFIVDVPLKHGDFL